MKRIIYITIFLFFVLGCSKQKSNQNFPNIILVTADDLGYGDVACYGNPTVLTPHLDEMANAGIRFERFYSTAPVCSPTRGSCLTGRHPYRYNMPWAGRYGLPKEEITIAEALKTKGYSTRHFGKWHVGGLSKIINQSEFPGGPSPYSPPWENGFYECFSTESMMPTYNPYYQVGGEFGTEDYRFVQNEPVEKGQKTGGFRWGDFYWIGEDKYVEVMPEGDDSKIIMNKALDFIERKSTEKSPFLSVIWFHTPHTPVVAGNEQRAKYPDLDIPQQHWFGAISAMDEQIGVLREKLRKLQIEDNTIVWFCSDNGPSYIHNYNSSGRLRGKKAELYEGGVRVPAILEWPSKITNPFISQLPVSTSDFYPSILAICGIEMENQPILDGVNVMESILTKKEKRETPILFQSPVPNRLKKQETEDVEQFSIVDNNYKLISIDGGKSFQLYDLNDDPTESIDIVEKK
ncbi:MAG: sulfatase-like hydrolase/transferase [Prolixibacteraceae bacterium]|jgi:arylsulfatase A-like enzyme|nr:sulfatase-like hydrolase/transferase [Prolixibacteraceae bacterium]MBT6006670.1 sulfatase-like hydrolase/transferase [Prolixibacteraceae bacterium]MBT6763915.1 sulfatase-like hydrolase/transferase [Prolixibacteraceae bacterium]MBT6998226.1 sulfatase-like hydrolase/transferase [Prolixibacteraceae bacterium]MBT7394158.1 sulfatase-like hydrolase/transferase [Prolixibacteraceae bacterium]